MKMEKEFLHVCSLDQHFFDSSILNVQQQQNGKQLSKEAEYQQKSFF